MVIFECRCGFSCGTLDAFNKHIFRYNNPAEHGQVGAGWRSDDYLPFPGHGYAGFSNSHFDEQHRGRYDAGFGARNGVGIERNEHPVGLDFGISRGFATAASGEANLLNFGRGGYNRDFGRGASSCPNAVRSDFGMYRDAGSGQVSAGFERGPPSSDYFERGPPSSEDGSAGFRGGQQFAPSATVPDGGFLDGFRDFLKETGWEGGFQRAPERVPEDFRKPVPENGDPLVGFFREHQKRTVLETPESKWQKTSQRGSAPSVVPRTYSGISEEAIAGLQSVGTKLSSLESRTAAVELELEIDGSDAATSQVHAELADIETAAKSLESIGIDAVETADITSGKVEAKFEKKLLFNRVNSLLKRIDAAMIKVMTTFDDGSSKVAVDELHTKISEQVHAEQKPPAAETVQPSAARQMSFLSLDAIESLQGSHDALSLLEQRVETIADFLGNGAIGPAQARTDLAHVESAVSRLECDKIDSVYTSDLNSGKTRAKEEKKQQLARVEQLFQKLENLFRKIKELA